MKFLLSACVLQMLFFGYNPAQEEAAPVEKAKFYLQKLQEAYNNGHYEKHKAYSDSLYDFSKANALTSYEILGMVNQAVYYNNAGEPNESIALYRKALERCDSIPEDYRSKIIILVNLANVYTRVEASEKAIDTFKEVIALLDQYEDNERIRAAALMGLANNFEANNNSEQAFRYFSQARDLAKKTDDETVLVLAISGISEYYYQQGDYVQAIREGKEALSVPAALKPTKHRAWLLLRLGISEVKMQHLDTALVYLEEAAFLGQSKGLKEVEMHANKHLFEVDSIKGNIQRAQTYKEQYLLLKNEFLNSQKSAIQLDLEEDLSDKNEIIESKETVISNLLKNKKVLLLSSTLFAILLALVSFAFIQHNQRSRKKRLQLQAKFQDLQKQLVTTTNGPENEPEQENRTSNYRNSSLTKEDLHAYKKQLLDFMVETKPYLNSELSQKDLAAQLNISSHYLSEILNNGFDQNFYTFINSYRVMEAQRLMKADPKQNSKILAIAFDSGFKSKTSFNRAFKQYMGMTPSEYRQQLHSTT
ncbi:tetratricopeptide repeat protein [Flavobacteriaceae bacterium M23B6Z8]